MPHRIRLINGKTGKVTEIVTDQATKEHGRQMLDAVKSGGSVVVNTSDGRSWVEGRRD